VPLKRTLDENFKRNDPSMLYLANKYIYINYYVYNANNYVNKILSEFLSIEYSGDIEIWDCIIYALVLHLRIKQKEGNVAATQKIKEKIFYPSTLITDEVKIRKKAKKLQRVLEGDLLTTEKIEFALLNGWLESELNWRLINLMQLTYICSLGGSELLPVTRVEEVIVKNCTAIKRLIESGVDLSKALL
jgi:hypothetical protein